MNGKPTATAAGNIDVGGDLTVNRLGFGAMRVRPGPGQWVPDGRPEHLRRACEGSVARLRLDRIDLYQFHRPDPRVPIAESIGTLAELKDEGKVRHIGVSNFTETGTIPALMGAARGSGVSEPQVALAWLLTRSPQVLPIPGSSNPDHVKENVAAAEIELTAEEIRAITLAVLGR